MTPYLSIELLELVVDHLHADRPALAACALSSSLLLSVARHHLFGAIELKGTAERASALLALLDANPALAHIITSLHASPGSKAGVAWVDVPPPAGLKALLTRMPALRSLQLQHVSLSALCRAGGPDALSGFPVGAIRSLKLRGCDFPTDAALVALLVAAPLLKQLSLSLCDWDTSAFADTEVVIEPSVAVDTLTVLAFEGWAVIGRPWLNGLALHSLVNLKVTLYTERDIAFWQTHFDGPNGALLRRLELVGYDYSPCELNLGGLIELRELTMFANGRVSRERGEPLSRLVRLLECIPALAFETTTCAINYPAPEFLARVDWARLGAAGAALRTRAPHARLVLALNYPQLTPADESSAAECERVCARAVARLALGAWVSVARTQLNMWA